MLIVLQKHEPTEVRSQSTSSYQEEEGRSHIITIPRPPEWSVPQADSAESESDESDEESNEEVLRHEEQQAAPYAGPERGIATSLPHLELYGIEILELFSPSITIKCTRCKTQLDITNLKNNAGEVSNPRSETCKKCGIIFAIGEVIPTFGSYLN